MHTINLLQFTSWFATIIQIQVIQVAVYIVFYNIYNNYDINDLRKSISNNI